MRKQIIYSWNQDDESLAYLNEALNRVHNFKDWKNELDIQGIHSFHKIYLEKKFADEDVKILFSYFILLSSRIYEKYGKKEDEFSKSVSQAADNIKEVAHRFLAYFNFQKKLLDGKD